MRVLSVLILAALSGCTHLQLERVTSKQIATQSDIYYTEVLNGLAMVSKYPGALPPFTLLGTGQIQITDTGSNTDMVMPNGQGVVGSSFGLTASRADQLNWTIWPVSDPDRLALMRCVYQLSLGRNPADCDQCYDKLRTLLCPPAKPGDAVPTLPPEQCMACAIPQGWMNVGCRKDVPHNACYVGHYRDTYVWVMPEGLEGLTRMTLTVLDIATVQYGTALSGPPGQITPPSQHTLAPSILKPRITPFILNPNVPSTPR